MKKKIIAVMMTALLICSLASCGSSGKSESGYYSYDYTAEDYGASPSQYGKSDASYDVPNAADGRKVIYRASYSIETTAFDESWEDIRDACARYGAYISSSSLTGGRSYADGTYRSRYLELTVRVPAENYGAFLEERTAFGSVTDFRESTDDVTSNYVDTEARLKALRTQEERLLALITEAKDLTELLMLEDKLEEVRYEIESAQSLLNTYDDLISFCTVNITVREVNVISNVNTGFGYKVKERFISTWVDFVNVLQEIVLGIITLLPLLIIAGIAAFFIIRKVRKNRAGQLERIRMNAKAPKEETPDE